MARAERPRRKTAAPPARRKDARPARQNGGKAKARGEGRGEAKRPARGQKPARRRSLWGRLVVWSLVAAIWLGLAGAGVLAYYAHDLPDVDAVAAQARKPSVTLLARDGSVLAAYGQLYGEAITLSDLPPALPRAVLAIEDRRFYYHPGVDPIGLARALYVNLRAGHVVQGGSTITQQLAKNLFLTPKRTIKRKVQEVILAFWLEWKFTKDEILALYLNRVYLGAGAYGVDAAAQRFFDKPASTLNIYESAMIAGLLKAPSRYNPVSNQQAAHERTRVVLQNMVANGDLSAKAAARIARERRRGRTPPAWQGRYFADWVLGQVQSYVGFHPKDLTVATTLDPGLQRIAESRLNHVLAREGAAQNARQGAAVLVSPQGAVRAMVGGRDYRDSQFNRATEARRQPGSAFKPFVYLAALESNADLRPDSTLMDEPVTVGDWTPDNYNGRYYGEVTLREAFARSLNAVAVKLTQRAGPKRVARTARRLGIESPLDATPSLALGTSEVSLLELTGAYAVLANGGQGVFPHGIARIRDSDGRTLYDRRGDGPGRAVAPRHIARMTDLMRANVAWGTGRNADPGRPAAGKTGTSQDSRDAWFVGFTAGLVGGVWVGNDDGAPMDNVTGGTLPARIWRETMTRALDGIPPRPLPGLRQRPDTNPQDASPGTAATDQNDGDAPQRSKDGGGSVIDRIIGTITGGASNGGTSNGGGAAATRDAETPRNDQRGR